MASDKLKSDTNNGSEIDWSPENEIKLFYALRGHKPVGVAKNFHMISILEEFVKLTEKDVSSKTIWKRLDKLYDMDTLHENENPPFPTNSVPFSIEGIQEFDEMIAKLKTGTDSIKSDKVIDIKDDVEVNTTPVKAVTKAKTQELNKTNTKLKPENEKNSKTDRKDESNVKQLDKTEEIEDKTNRLKKQITKPTPELRSASHNASSSAKKRK